MELMAPKAKKIPPSAPPKTFIKVMNFGPRDGLRAYTDDPTNERVIFYTDEFVAIRDLYPKASVHTLLLWRSPDNLNHPFLAFQDAEFLSRVSIILFYPQLA
jgi:aprataxin